MSDASLLERLRGWRWSSNLDSTICEEAAAEIERLTREEQQAKADRHALREECSKLARQKETYRNACQAKQARIDALMLEFCPGEMSAEQRAEWARNQKPGKPFTPFQDFFRKMAADEPESPAEPSSEP